METMLGFAVCIFTVFMLFKYRGAIDEHAKAAQASARAQAIQTKLNAIRRANRVVQKIERGDYLTLDEIEELLDNGCEEEQMEGD